MMVHLMVVRTVPCIPHPANSGPRCKAPESHRRSFPIYSDGALPSQSCALPGQEVRVSDHEDASLGDLVCMVEGKR